MEKNFKKYITVGAIIVLVISEALTIKVAMSKIEDKNNEIVELKNDYKKETEDIKKEYSKQMQSAKDEIKNMQSEIKSIKSDFDKVTAENKKLKEDARQRKLVVSNRGGRASVKKEVEIVVSHYCPCSKCNGKWTGQPTKLGTSMVAGRTVAGPVDILGKKIYVEGYGSRIVEDTGHEDYIRWIVPGKKLKIDMFVNSHSEAMKKGIVHTKGYILY